MANEEHLAILRQEVKARHAWVPEQPPRPAGRAGVEDALEAGVRVETKRGLGCRLVVGGDP
jgi:hypothetical protein